MSDSREVSEGQDEDLREEEEGQDPAGLPCRGFHTLYGGSSAVPWERSTAWTLDAREYGHEKDGSCFEDPGGGERARLPRRAVLLRAAVCPATHLLKAASEQTAASLLFGRSTRAPDSPGRCCGSRNGCKLSCGSAGQTGNTLPVLPVDRAEPEMLCVPD